MLRTALLVNVVFSLCCGTLAILNVSWLQAQIPLPSIVLSMLAGGLLIFACTILWVRGSEERLLKYTRLIISSDFSWVLSTSILTVVFYQDMSVIALVLVVITNACVGCLAIWQTIGFQKLKRGHGFA